MPIQRIELAVEYDENIDDALLAVAQITAALGLDSEQDIIEIESGTSETGMPVLVVLLIGQEESDDVRA